MDHLFSILFDASLVAQSCSCVLLHQPFCVLVLLRFLFFFSLDEDGVDDDDEDFEEDDEWDD